MSGFRIEPRWAQNRTEIGRTAGHRLTAVVNHGRSEAHMKLERKARMVRPLPDSLVRHYPRCQRISWNGEPGCDRPLS
jgi:hypothetical protein